MNGFLDNIEKNDCLGATENQWHLDPLRFRK
jgi:hypothetical protein